MFKNFSVGIIFVLTMVVISPVAAQLANAPWPMFHHDVRHTGLSPYTGPETPVLKWNYPGISWPEASPAIDSLGRIYISGYGLFCIDSSGSFVWSYPNISCHYSSPAIDQDGTIYVGSFDEPDSFFAFNPDGTIKWAYPISVEGSSPVIGEDGTVYIGTSYEHKLYAFYPDGTLKWEFPIGSWTQSDPALGVDGTIYIGSGDHNLYAIEDSVTYGRQRWTFNADERINTSPALNESGVIYFSSLSTLYSLDDSITHPHLRWTYPIGSFSSPAIGEQGTIYVGAGNSLYAIEDSINYGRLKWTYSVGAQVQSSPAIDAQGTIYFGCQDFNLYAIEDSITYATLKWLYPTGGQINYASPGIGGDGTIYIASTDGKLYAIGQSDIVHDVGVVSIDIPKDSVFVNLYYMPRALISNFGNVTDSFATRCIIDTAGIEIFDDTVFVEVIPSCSLQIIFAPWLVDPDIGIDYNIEVITMLSGDSNPDNDTMNIITQSCSCFCQEVCWVSDQFTVKKVSSEGEIIFSVSEPGWNNPIGDVSANSVDRTCWVGVGNGQRVVKIAPDGVVAIVHLLPYMSSISVDSTTGDCWVALLWNNEIVKLAPDGHEIFRVSGFNHPYSVSVNSSDGACWVADRDNHRVVKLSADGSELVSVAGFSGAFEVSVNETDGTCWVVDIEANTVVKLTSEGAIDTTITGFTQPFSVSVNSSDSSCWVADIDANQVWKLSANGDSLFTVPISGGPRSVSVNSENGTCWVVCVHAGKLVKLSPTGEILVTLTGLNHGYDVSVNPYQETGIEEQELIGYEHSFSLHIYPNPFRQMTTIKFQVPRTKSFTPLDNEHLTGQANSNPAQADQITLKIYDVSGRIIKSFDLASGVLPLASAVAWNGTDNSGNRVPPGVYFCRLRVDDKALTTKVIKLID